jgi:hypothetical protein
MGIKNRLWKAINEGKPLPWPYQVLKDALQRINTLEADLEAMQDLYIGMYKRANETQMDILHEISQGIKGAFRWVAKPLVRRERECYPLTDEQIEIGRKLGVAMTNINRISRIHDDNYTITEYYTHVLPKRKLKYSGR